MSFINYILYIYNYISTFKDELYVLLKLFFSCLFRYFYMSFRYMFFIPFRVFLHACYGIFTTSLLGSVSCLLGLYFSRLF